MRHDRPAVDLPGHVDLVVLPVGPDTPGAPEPSPESEPALLGEVAREDQRPVPHPEVAPRLLEDAVEVDLVGLAHGGGQRDVGLRHRAQGTPGGVVGWEPVNETDTPGYGRSAAPDTTRGIANNTTIGFPLVRRPASTARRSRSGRPSLTDSTAPMAPLKSEIAYSIRRSARARRVRVTVDAGG